MFDWLRKRLQSNPIQEKSEPVLEEEVKVKIAHTPPILLRLNVGDELNNETNAQFCTVGWCRGEDHRLTIPFSHMMYHAVNTKGHWTSDRMDARLREHVTLTAIQVTHADNIQYQGDKILALYCPSYLTLPDRDGNEAPMTCSLSGGPTQDFLDLIKHVAMVLQVRIIAMETAPDGVCLVMFTPWTEDYLLRDVHERTIRDITDEALDNPDGKMEGGEGT